MPRTALAARATGLDGRIREVDKGGQITEVWNRRRRQCRTARASRRPMVQIPCRLAASRRRSGRLPPSPPEASPSGYRREPARLVANAPSMDGLLYVRVPPLPPPPPTRMPMPPPPPLPAWARRRAVGRRAAYLRRLRARVVEVDVHRLRRRFVSAVSAAAAEHNAAATPLPPRPPIRLKLPMPKPPRPPPPPNKPPPPPPPAAVPVP